MFRAVMDAIIDELNVGVCARDIANHWACRCTVPGPGMRKAAEILKRRYEENGAKGVEIVPYPADDRTEFLDGRKNSLEWRPFDSSLAIVQPESEAAIVCRYSDEPLSLVCYSAATPPEGVCAELVVKSGPLNESEVAEGEWEGRMLFTDQPPGSVEGAARKGRASGVLSDCVCPPWLSSHPPVREPEDAPDLVMWTCLSGSREEHPLFAFNLSARQGRRLRMIIARSSEPVILKATVKAESVEGSSDFVHAVVPGTDLAEEEIWVLAHLSEPGARDNASGCCLSLELARTLTALTSSGKLPPLRRTLRFMHAVEVSGFLPYIDANLSRLPKVVAGLCLDSVGQDFAICGGELVLYQSPEQDPSFVDGLLAVLLEAARDEPIARFSENNYATFPWHADPFWGNDAFISDGFFNIPTPQLSSWPDRFYHSSQDTPDQISDNSLGRIGAVTGTYLYLMATAGAKEARWFGHLAACDWKHRLCKGVSDHLTAALALETATEDGSKIVSHLRHLGLQGYDAVIQADRLAPENGELKAQLNAIAREVLAFSEREAVQAASSLSLDLTGVTPAQSPTQDSFPGQGLVARRLRWGAPPMESLSESTRQRLAELSQSEDREADLNRIWGWINGRRTAEEIRQRLDFEGEVQLALILEYLRLMAKEGALELVVEE